MLIELFLILVAIEIILNAADAIPKRRRQRVFEQWQRENGFRDD